MKLNSVRDPRGINIIKSLGLQVFKIGKKLRHVIVAGDVTMVINIKHRSLVQKKMQSVKEQRGKKNNNKPPHSQTFRDGSCLDNDCVGLRGDKQHTLVLLDHCLNTGYQPPYIANVGTPGCPIKKSQIFLNFRLQIKCVREGESRKIKKGDS